jgi:hypothetical protein
VAAPIPWQEAASNDQVARDVPEWASQTDGRFLEPNPDQERFINFVICSLIRRKFVQQKIGPAQI